MHLDAFPSWNTYRQTIPTAPRLHGSTAATEHQLFYPGSACPTATYRIRPPALGHLRSSQSNDSSAYQGMTDFPLRSTSYLGSFGVCISSCPTSVVIPVGAEAAPTDGNLRRANSRRYYRRIISSYYLESARIDPITNSPSAP